MLTSYRRRVSYLKVANPHWFVLVFAALLWVYYVWQQLSIGNAPHHQHIHHGMHANTEFSLLKLVFDWMVMVYAMMLPMTSGTIRSIVNRIPLTRQSRSLALFIFGYSLIWFIFGLMLLYLTALLADSSLTMMFEGLPVAAIAYALAGLMCNAKFRVRLLTACGSIWAPRITGLKADIDILKIGFDEGVKCVQTCAHIMIAMHIAGHSLLQMAILTIALFYEKHLYRNKKNLLRYTCMLLSVWELIMFY